MTTRREALALFGAGAAAVLTGCGPAGPEPAASAPDLVLAQVAEGLAVLRADGVERLGAGLAAPDGATVFAARAEGVDTVLSTIELRTGRRTPGPRLAGAWVPRVASADGRLVALAAPDSAGVTHVPAGRARTPLVVAGTTAEVARLELTGNLVPDAFTAGGEGLFVLDWLPPAAPDRYRVRHLDVASGKASRLLTRLKAAVPDGAEEEMSGEGRFAVYAPDRQVLYTLYTHQPDHTHTRDLVAGRRSNVHAFVHTLHLTEQWAFCVDLPAPFGEGPGTAHTLAIAPDRSELYVLDVSSGTYAVIDTGQLTVRSTAKGPRAAGTAYAAATFDALYVAVGESVHTTPRTGVSAWRTWTAGGSVSGLAASPDGRRVYAALPGRIAWFDAATGARLGEHPVPGLTGLTRVL
ncbi:hypothetical protein CS0771_77390 [Catellatospora sp. IY07-71]|uniref:YncE family protein n=1 Tax=Catellatospora sp. IY07-71 TaxID=2728827 RepID=UPI001BB3DF27|nr:hypothetical protein [Catellatospora sp. IY07-71]BCJ78195.1 hypothetical protein CS0771_77390 [Catellatospora sp. IY07-71]